MTFIHSAWAKSFQCFHHFGWRCRCQFGCLSHKVAEEAKKYENKSKEIFQWKGKHFESRVAIGFFSSLSYLKPFLLFNHRYISFKRRSFETESHRFQPLLNNGWKLIFIWKNFHQLSFGRRLIASGQMATTQWTGKERKKNLQQQKKMGCMGSFKWNILSRSSVTSEGRMRKKTHEQNDEIIYWATSCKSYSAPNFELYQIRSNAQKSLKSTFFPRESLQHLHISHICTRWSTLRRAYAMYSNRNSDQ